MPKIFARVMLFFIILAPSLGASAFEEAPTLRDLAEQNDIYIGAAVYVSHLNDPLFVDILGSQFNMLTPENEAKACELQPRLGQFDFRNFDTLMDFAEEHEMTVHGHTLLWHQCVPSWLANGPFSRDEAIDALRDHIMTVVGRYKGRIAIWDVANETIADDGSGLRDTPWRQWIGDDYVELAFQFAHEADPDALLFYNDYNIESVNDKSDAVYAMVSDFLARGIPIHGVGMQSHMILGQIDPYGIAKNMQRLGELGMQVQITELDVRFEGEPSDQILRRQASDYRRMMETCLESEYCTAFITWGVSDRYTWLRGSNLGFFENPVVAPLLFDDDYNPKPAYDALVEVLTEYAGE